MNTIIVVSTVIVVIVGIRSAILASTPFAITSAKELLNKWRITLLIGTLCILATVTISLCVNHFTENGVDKLMHAALVYAYNSETVMWVCMALLGASILIINIKLAE